MAQLTNSQINGSVIVSGTGSFLGSFITKDLIASGSIDATGDIHGANGSFIGTLDVSTGDASGITISGAGRKYLTFKPTTTTNRSTIMFGSNQSGSNLFSIETDRLNTGSNNDLYFFNQQNILTGNARYQLFLGSNGTIGLGVIAPQGLFDVGSKFVVDSSGNGSFVGSVQSTAISTTGNITTSGGSFVGYGGALSGISASGGGVGSSAVGVSGSLSTWSNSGSIQPVKASVDANGNGSFLGSVLVGSLYSQGNVIANGSVYGYGGTLTGLGGGLTGAGTSGSIAVWNTATNVSYQNASIDSNSNAKFAGSIIALSGSFLGSLIGSNLLLRDGAASQELLVLDRPSVGKLAFLNTGGTPNTFRIQISNSVGSSSIPMYFAAADGNNFGSFDVYLSNSSSGSVPAFAYDSSAQMIGIGTNTPSQKLTINGDTIGSNIQLLGSVLAGSLSTTGNNNITGSVIASFGVIPNLLPQGVLPSGSIPSLSTLYIPQGQLITGSLPNTINISGSVIAPYGSFSDEIITRDFTATSNGSFVGSTIASVSRVSGSFTGSYLELSSNGNSDSGSQVLLRFNSDRPWSFRTIGSQASTTLVLRDEGSSKLFKIQDSVGSDNVIFGPTNSAGVNTTLYVKPYGSVAGAVEIDGGNSTGSILRIYGSSTTTTRLSVNYLGSVMLGIAVPTHALNVLGTGSLTGSLIANVGNFNYLTAAGGSLTNTINLGNGKLSINAVNTGSTSYYPLDIYSYNDYGSAYATNGVVRFIGSGNLGYNKITFAPEGMSAGEKMIFQVHHRNWVDNSVHKHASIYTTGADGSTFLKRLNLPYDADIADWDIQNSRMLFSKESTLWIGLNKFVDNGGTDEAILRISPYPNVAGSDTQIGLFRETDTTGKNRFIIYRGNGSATAAFTLEADNGSSYFTGTMDLQTNAIKGVTNLTASGSIIANYGSISTSLIAGSFIGYGGALTGLPSGGLPQGVLPVGSIPTLTAYIPQGQLITGSLPNNITISGDVNANDELLTGSLIVSTNGSFLGSVLAERATFANTVTISRGTADNFSTGYNVQKRGNNASATGSVASGAELGYHSFFGWDGAAFNRAAYAITVATQDYALGSAGGQYRIATTPNNSTSAAVRLVINQDGSVTMGASNGTGLAGVYMGSLHMGTTMVIDQNRNITAGSVTGTQGSFSGSVTAGSLYSAGNLTVAGSLYGYGGTLSGITASGGGGVGSGTLGVAGSIAVWTNAGSVEARKGSIDANGNTVIVGSLTAGSIVSTGNINSSGSLFGYGGTLSGITATAAGTNYAVQFNNGGTALGGTAGSLFWNGSQLGIWGSLTVSTNGTTEAAPAIMGFNNYSSGDAARFELGDESNGLQAAFGSDVEIYSYHPLVLRGGRGQTTAPTYFGSSTSYHTIAIAEQASKNAFAIRGAAAATSPLLQLEDSTTAIVAFVRADGTGSFAGSVVAREFQGMNIAKWTTVSGSTTVGGGVGYFTGSTARVIFTLPTTMNVGTIFKISGSESGGWSLKQNANQFINFGNTTSTAGTTGSLHSNNRYNSVELVCTRAGSEWNVISSVGTIGVK